MAMDPNKRGNPPFEPSSYATGLERRVLRCQEWSVAAREMARDLLDGNPLDRITAEGWWRQQLNMPQVILSVEDLVRAAQGMETRQGGDAEAAPSRSDDSPVAESDAPNG